MVDLDSLLADLADESAELDGLLADRPAAAWALPTPAPGWTVAHQIAHLTWTDRVALLAATDRGAFRASVAAAAVDPTGFIDAGAEEVHAEAGGPAQLLRRWRSARAALADALAAIPPGEKLPWYGTAMSAASMATARIMETWAHGQDVADALGHHRNPSARLRHVAHLGVRTMAHGFAVHGRRAPETGVRVELSAPDGTEWTYGPTDATDLVRGPALDFCLLVTQRRHRADLNLVTTGPAADEWLDVAQAYAGPPGPGREPGGARAANPPGPGREPDGHAGAPPEGTQ